MSYVFYRGIVVFEMFGLRKDKNKESFKGIRHIALSLNGIEEWAKDHNQEVVDSWKEGVIEPLKVKTQAIKSASEVTELILRIDDIIASKGDPNPMANPGMSPDMMM